MEHFAPQSIHLQTELCPPRRHKNTVYSHYKLHLHFDIIWLVNKHFLEFFEKMYPGYTLEIPWKLVMLDL